MATVNSTRSTNGDEKVTYYASLSPLHRVEAALEMATEIKESLSQHFALASVVTSTLAPAEPGGDAVDWHAFRLAQILEEVMSDVSQVHRLLDCLTASQVALVREGGAA